MVFNKNMVAVVKCNGKIMKEYKDTIYIPFDSEYSLLLKNLNSKKALVNIWIDNVDILNGNQLIVNANSELELERFIDDLDIGRKFKFIKKTDTIRDLRGGDKIDDGIIKIEYKFEREVYQIPKIDYYPIYTYTYPQYNWICGSSSGTQYSQDTFTVSCMDSPHPKSILRSMNCSLDNSVSFDNLNSSINNQVCEDGLTIKGSESTQQFKYGNIGELESESHIISFMLKGKNKDEIEILQPITVKTKLECSVCSTKNNGKYCTECGNYLL
jgi:hypothetical protein